jgi:hypothetical protein
MGRELWRFESEDERGRVLLLEGRKEEVSGVEIR